MKKNANKVEEKVKVEVVENQINYDALTYDELSELSRKAHQNDVKEYDKEQNSLCKIVIGSILLIIGILFFILSFKRVKNKMAGLDYLSLQFFISIIATVIAIILLAIGITRLVRAHKQRKILKQEISILAQHKDKRMVK